MVSRASIEELDRYLELHTGTSRRELMEEAVEVLCSGLRNLRLEQEKRIEREQRQKYDAAITEKRAREAQSVRMIRPCPAQRERRAALVPRPERKERKVSDMSPTPRERNPSEIIQTKFSAKPGLAARALSLPAFHVTFFKDEFAKTYTTDVLTLGEVQELMLATTAPTKKGLPWFKLARFGDKRNDKSGSLRHDANVLAISGVEGDYDGEEVSIDQAVAILNGAGVWGIICTSPSHKKDAPRWRVICPTSEELPPTERAKLLARVNGLLGGILAGESFTLSQSYYYGRVGNNPDHRCEIVSGDFIDERADLDAGALGKGEPPTKASKRLTEMAPGNINTTQTAAMASLLSGGKSLDEAVEKVLEATERVGDPDWDYEKERAQIRSMGERWLKKHPELVRTDNAPPYSEEAIALDFATRHADGLRYVAKWNEWFIWDGTCWREDETRRAFTVARGLCRETAATANKPSERKKIASAKTRAAVVSLAGEDYQLAATTDQWDADPWLLNTPDGAVDLRTGQMREHRTDDYMTKQTAVAPAGDCPRWKAFLDEVTAGDRELQAYLQGVSGYCLTGITREQQLYFMYGSGQNGKGVFVQTISGIMGDYHRATSIETFTVSQSERHPTELAALRGARLVTAAETEDGRRWAEARIKEMTGGDKIQARFMRQDFFEFFPQFKLIFSGNHMPTLRTINKAITRRFNRVPFAVTIVAEKMNLYLTEELRAEWPGILAWMIKGCLMWQRDGLKPPKAVSAATEQYLESQDAIGEWLKECCELAPGYWESTQELFTSWKPWAGERGEWIGSKNQFSQKLEDRGGFVPQRSEDRKHRGFRGLRLRRPSTIDELVDRWINECCEVGNDFWTDAVRASKSWQAFIKKQDGVSGVSAWNLQETLRTRGLACCNDAGSGWQGLRIKETDRPAAAGSAGDGGADDADDADVIQPE